MLVVSAENTSSITITSATSTSSIEVSPIAAASIPLAFELRVFDLESAWEKYANNIHYDLTQTVVLASGEVLTGIHKGVTSYRYITTATDANGYPTEDSFYTGFDGTSLTGLITTRNV